MYPVVPFFIRKTWHTLRIDVVVLDVWVEA